MNDLAYRVIKLARQIQQIPAPTFAESQRAELLREAFDRAGLLDVGMDELNNVYARVPGASAAVPPVLVTAHIDTVFPEGTKLSLREESGRLVGPGIGDNAVGAAGLLGLVWSLQAGQQEPLGDLWLAANVREEGLGDLEGMRAVLRRLGGRVQAVLVLEGMALGHIYHRGIGVRRYSISIQTEGGHSWLRFGQPSANHVLMQLGARLADLSVPAQPRTTLNIGLISGGISVNTIASQASLLLDLRSEDSCSLRELAERVEAVAQSFQAPGISVEIRVVGDRPPGDLSPQHPLTQLAVRCLEAAGIFNPHLEAGSTDANLPLSCGLPALCLGLTRGGSSHTQEEYIETEPLEQGLRALTLTVLGAYALPGPAT